MATMISEAEAQRDIARILREAGKGQRFVVTADGRPVAEIVPPDSRPATHIEPPDDGMRTPEELEAAKTELLAHLRSQPARDVGPWTREELYER